MARSRRSFRRSLGQRRYKRLFIIATEGIVTERQYFDFFNSSQSIIQVKCLKSRKDNAPLQVLNRMKRHLRQESLKETDQAWLVVDRDMWINEQLTTLFLWSKQADNYGFALSNPKFEYWLLLHFEDGSGVSSPNECSERLCRYIPEYDKRIDMRKITWDMVQLAIERAQRRDTPPCEDWPRTTGTTVYRLVQKLLEHIIEQ